MNTAHKFALRVAIVLVAITVLTLLAWGENVRVNTLRTECDAGRASACAELAARR